VNGAYLCFHVNDVNMTCVKSPMTPTRDSYHHGDLRNALLETGLRLVAERGEEGFSLREAARAVGVSPGAAYRHFADRAALLAAIAADGHGRLAAALERAEERAEGTPGSAARAVRVFAAIGEAYVDFAVRHPSHFRVMFGPCTQVEGFAPSCAPSGRGAFQILVDALDRLVEAGVITARARAGGELAAWATVHGLSALIVDGALPLTGRARTEAARSVGRTMLAGLGCDPRQLPPAGAPVLVGDPRLPEAGGRKQR